MYDPHVGASSRRQLLAWSAKSYKYKLGKVEIIRWFHLPRGRLFFSFVAESFRRIWSDDLRGLGIETFLEVLLSAGFALVRPVQVFKRDGYNSGGIWNWILFGRLDQLGLKHDCGCFGEFRMLLELYPRTRNRFHASTNRNGDLSRENRSQNQPSISHPSILPSLKTNTRLCRTPQRIPLFLNGVKLQS